MPSKFGGVSIEEPSGSKFGGIPVENVPLSRQYPEEPPGFFTPRTGKLAQILGGGKSADEWYATHPPFELPPWVDRAALLVGLAEVAPGLIKAAPSIIRGTPGAVRAAANILANPRVSVKEGTKALSGLISSGGEKLAQLLESEASGPPMPAAPRTPPAWQTSKPASSAELSATTQGPIPRPVLPSGRTVGPVAPPAQPQRGAPAWQQATPTPLTKKPTFEASDLREARSQLGFTNKEVPKSKQKQVIDLAVKLYSERTSVPSASSAQAAGPAISAPAPAPAPAVAAMTPSAPIAMPAAAEDQAAPVAAPVPQPTVSAPAPIVQPPAAPAVAITGATPEITIPSRETLHNVASQIQEYAVPRKVTNLTRHFMEQNKTYDELKAMHDQAQRTGDWSKIQQAEKEAYESGKLMESSGKAQPETLVPKSPYRKSTGKPSGWESAQPVKTTWELLLEGYPGSPQRQQYSVIAPPRK